MDKIFNQAKDKNVATIKVYAKANDAYAYSDSANTKKIDAATLQDLFLKGCVVISGDDTFAPVGLNVDADVATLTYVKADTTTATTAVLATVKSSEYTAG